MNDLSEKCIFCGLNINRQTDFDREISHCFCDNCGEYLITAEALSDLPIELKSKHEDKKYLISGYLREMYELGLSKDVITNDNFKYLFNNAKVPKTLYQKLEKLLLYLYRETKIFNEEIIIDSEQVPPAIGYAKNRKELDAMLTGLEELGLLKPIKGRGLGKRICTLTVKGFELAENLQAKPKDSNQCFVAMWFDDSIKKLFNNSISRAVRDTGFEPFIIDMKEHNDDICDHIIAEIRKSRFMIADFTGHRGGVYFEAGFAYGLGIPVIWTCRNDWFNCKREIEIPVTVEGQQKKAMFEENREIHFDINHFNFIRWVNGDDLYDKLVKRINATIIK